MRGPPGEGFSGRSVWLAGGFGLERRRVSFRLSSGDVAVPRFPRNPVI